jgi:hypothetical protein
MSENSWGITQKKILDEAIENSESIVKIPGTDLQEMYKVPLEESKPKKSLKVFTIDIGLVNYNFDNVRIGKYKKKYCLKNNIDKLNSEDPKHQDIVQTILLNSKSYSKTKIKSLKKDLIDVGQEEPALITQFGTLWNGNRRVAQMRELFKEPEKLTGSPLALNQIKVCLLPNDFEDDDLRALEKRLQQDKETKEGYGLVSEMWKIQTELNECIAQDYFETDVTTPTKKEEDELKAEIGSDNYDTWPKILDAKKTIDLMDQYLQFAEKKFKEPMEGDYDIIEKNEDVTWFVELNTLLEKHVIPYYENNPEKGNSVIMEIKWKYKCFAAYSSDSKNDYHEIRDLWATFKDAKGTGEPKDTTNILDNIQEQSPIISEWEPISTTGDPNEPIENLIKLCDETREKDGVETKITDIEQESFKTNTRQRGQIAINPTTSLGQIEEKLQIILGRKEHIPKKNKTLKQKIDNCKQALTEIEKYSEQTE